MKRDDDFASRRKQREEEDAQEREEALARGKPGAKPGQLLGGNTAMPASASDSFDDLLHRVQTLIDQTNGLYNQYFTGVEKRPPVEKRKQLEDTMKRLQNTAKPTAGHRFRFGSLQASYTSHMDRWDRQLQAIEKGKK